MDYYENHPKSKTHIDNLNRLNNIWKYCGACKDDTNNSSWNRHVKNHKAIFSNADHKGHAGSANEKRLPFLPMFLICLLIQYRF